MNPNTARLGADHIVLLDGLRGLAAILVLLGHMGATIFPNSLPVDFFFLLSGYVIARAYEKKFFFGMTFVEFAKIRLIRLYPVIFLGSALMLVVVLCGMKDVTGNLFFVSALQFAIVPIFAPGLDIFRINGVQWSLFFELLANAAHKLLFPRLNVPNLVLVSGVSFAALIGACVLYPSFTLGWWGDNAWVGIPRVAFPYFAGVLLYRILRDRGLLRIPGSLVLLMFVGLALVPNIHPVNGVRLAVLIGAFPGIVALSLGATLSRATAFICSILGELSYPLYATHLAILFPARYFLPNESGPSSILTNALIFCSCLALAFAVSRFWDRPIRAWLDQLKHSRRSTHSNSRS